MQLKAKIMDEQAVLRALRRISFEIIEKNHGGENICILGIARRGIPIANILADNIESHEHTRPPVGELDITSYRDDVTHIGVDPLLKRKKADFSVAHKHVIIVDDVLYTGRTARAAMDAVISMGRPASIQLAVLCDRGHRELPIRGDYIGKNIPTSGNEIVAVKMPEIDGEIAVELYSI